MELNITKTVTIEELYKYIECPWKHKFFLEHGELNYRAAIKRLLMSYIYKMGTINALPPSERMTPKQFTSQFLSEVSRIVPINEKQVLAKAANDCNKIFKYVHKYVTQYRELLYNNYNTNRYLGGAKGHKISDIKVETRYTFRNTSLLCYVDFIRFNTNATKKKTLILFDISSSPRFSLNNQSLYKAAIIREYFLSKGLTPDVEIINPIIGKSLFYRSEILHENVINTILLNITDIEEDIRYPRVGNWCSFCEYRDTICLDKLAGPRKKTKRKEEGSNGISENQEL
jgi:hypothetical protein